MTLKGAHIPQGLSDLNDPAASERHRGTDTEAKARHIEAQETHTHTHTGLQRLRVKT